MEFYFLLCFFCVRLNSCKTAQRGGAGEVCCEDKEEARGWAGGEGGGGETVAGLTRVTLIRGESQIETWQRFDSRASKEADRKSFLWLKSLVHRS